MSVLCLTLILASVAVFQVSAIGKCNNTVLKDILATNDFCPTSTPLLHSMWKIGGAVSFRALTKKYADVFNCATGVMDRPDNNVAVIHVKFSFKNESLAPLYVNYTMTESTCGLLYKHVVERDYVLFKIGFGYFDGISIGYYGCTDQTISTLDLNEQYAQCYTALSTVTTDEIEASLAKCKARMESVVPGSELVIIPPCDNDNEYLDERKKKRNF